MSEAGATLLDAALLLLRLLADSAALPVLGPLAEQEILYHLLADPDGARLRHITSGQGRLAQVGRAIAWITQNFRERFSIERLAAEVGMSPSSLILTDGTEVKRPPHLTGQMVFAVRPGDAGLDPGSTRTRHSADRCVVHHECSGRQERG